MIHDIQGQPDTRGLALELVGVTKVKLPLRIYAKKRSIQSVVASADFLTNLDSDMKGTHMSRFIEILYKISKEVIDLESMRKFTQEAKDKLKSTDAYLSLEFPYFIEKESPVTKNKSILDYTCTLITEIKSEKVSQTVKLAIPVMLLCPCSKAISKYNAHNQRSEVRLSVSVKKNLLIEYFGKLVEDEASCALYPLLKRPDEKYVTEKSYENPKFVEDIVRDIALKLIQNDTIESFLVECESFESIHNHNAYAKISSSDIRKTI